MKNWILLSVIFLSGFELYSQDTNDKENKQFELFNNFSTAYLFNTYALIGSLADGFDHDAYDESTVTDLLNAQKKLASGLAIELDKKLKDTVFTSEKRKQYLDSFRKILDEFNLQIDLFLKFVRNNSKKNEDAYITQRKKSWIDISNLVGIKD